MLINANTTPSGDTIERKEKNRSRKSSSSMTTNQDAFNFSGNNTNMNYSSQHQQQPQQPPPPPQFAGGQNQLVVAAQQSNPYSSFVAPPPTRSSTASVTSFDPFATSPPPPQQQQQSFPVAPQQQYQAQPASFPQPPPSSQEFSLAPPPQQQQQYQMSQQQPPLPTSLQSSQQFSAVPHTQIVPAQVPPHYNQDQQGSYPNNSYGHHEHRSVVSAPPPPPPTTVVVRDGGGNDDDDYSNSTGNYNQPNNESPRNPYSNALAVQVQGSNCAGLPKAELVGKRGFVLSRISFRTIVMKKWKQSFWVQYGGHTMLWFRSQGDFDDWLNNPYHDQSQRNFLIKLAVNFVHDLYKPNVRGYQVTQCRSKPYGKEKVIRQFKLERWMDYGPTIAAAFGSYDPKEVDACREAIVECMKNTPLDNGIRATGAVKEHHDRQQRAEEEQESRHLRQENQGVGGSNGYQNYQLDTTGNPPEAAQSMVAPVVDLLGDNNDFNDSSASLPQSTFVSTTPDLLFGDGGSRSLVPAANPGAYPGVPLSQMAAHPMQQQQQQVYPPQMQASNSHQGYSQYQQGYPQQPQQQADYPVQQF